MEIPNIIVGIPMAKKGDCNHLGTKNDFFQIDRSKQITVSKRIIIHHCIDRSRVISSYCPLIKNGIGIKAIHDIGTFLNSLKIHISMHRTMNVAIPACMAAPYNGF